MSPPPARKPRTIPKSKSKTKSSNTPAAAAAAAARRTVCDHCRRRRIRCDGTFPCLQCAAASLTCRRDHVPKRRGPKRGTGRVIKQLKAQEEEEEENAAAAAAAQSEKELTSTEAGECGHSDEGSASLAQWINDSAEASTSPTSSQQSCRPILTETSPSRTGINGILSTGQFGPATPGYFSLIPTCIDLFYEHIYPIMPLIYMPALREALTRPLQSFEKNLVYSLCAMTSTHMSGKNIHAPGLSLGSWEAAGRFFLNECILVRQSYDFVEDKTLWAVISSYLVHTAFFEINQSRKCWYYLREAMTVGLDLGLHDEKTYIGLSPEENLCRRRTFWILYVTERSYAILRHKPLTLSKTPSFPSTVHDYETSEIHSGFMHLVHSYHLLDSSFVDSWNEASDAPASTLTYTALQQHLNLPHPSHISLTNVQRADILVTQQWLRLIVWQSSMRQGLLSSTARDESMTFRYPLQIAHSLLNVISSLPTSSIEVHGMGIFEKIFEVGNTMLDVMQAHGNSIPHQNYGVSQDPFELFVRTLSQTPNSQRQYANLLLAKAAEKPEIQRFSQSLRPTLSSDLPVDLAFAGTDAGGEASITSDGLLVPIPSRPWRGSIVGEVNDEDEAYKEDVGVMSTMQRDAWSDASEWGIPNGAGGGSTSDSIAPRGRGPWLF